METTPSTKIDNRLPRLDSATVEKVEISREYKSGARYKGPVQDNKKIGRGVFVWPNGARYEGEFTDNIRHGNGKRSLYDIDLEFLLLLLFCEL